MANCSLAIEETIETMKNWRLTWMLGLISLLHSPLAAADTVPPSLHIHDLLPREADETICFTGSFKGHKVNVWDFSKAKQVPVPGLFEFGKQVTRTEPAISTGQEVSSLTVLVRRSSLEQKPGDELHGFRLKVTLKSRREPLYSAGECLWKALDGNNRDAQTVNPAVLNCYIECDGGGMQLERVGSGTDVLFRFMKEAGGLRMSGGCSKGDYHLGGEAKPYEANAQAESESPTEFRLTQTSKTACMKLTQQLGKVLD